MSISMKKIYYSIGEVSDIVELKQHVLRYWETEFSTLSPSKNRAGNRVYRDKDILLVRYIKHLLYDKKFTIEGAKQRIKEIKTEDLKKFSLTKSEESKDVKVSKQQLDYLIRELKKGLTDILQILED